MYCQIKLNKMFYWSSHNINKIQGLVWEIFKHIYLKKSYTDYTKYFFIPISKQIEAHIRNKHAPPKTLSWCQSTWKCADKCWLNLGVKSPNTKTETTTLMLTGMWSNWNAHALVVLVHYTCKMLIFSRSKVTNQ